MVDLTPQPSSSRAASPTPHAAAAWTTSSQGELANGHAKPPSAVKPPASTHMTPAAGSMQPHPGHSAAQHNVYSKGSPTELANQSTAAGRAPGGHKAASDGCSAESAQLGGSKPRQLQDYAAARGVGRSSASTLSLGNTRLSSATPSAATSQQGGDAGRPAFKACRKCNVTKEASAFQMDRHNVDGLQSYCRSCKAERARERRSEKDATPLAQADAAGSSVSRSKPVRRTASRTRLSQPQSPETSPPWGGLKLEEAFSMHSGVLAPAARAARSRPTNAIQHAAASVLPRVAPGHKRCSRCRVAKPRTDFHCNRTTADGLQYQCRTCHQEAIGSRASSHGRQPAGKRQASAGRADAPRKPKSRRLSDFSDAATSLSRDDGKPDGFALLQRAAAVASTQDCQQDVHEGGLQQRAHEATAAVQQRRRITVTHKLCSKCHTLKPATDFWKNKSTADGLQWFCRACQTRVCHTLKDAARLRVAAGNAAADAEGLLQTAPALKGSHPAAFKRKAAGRPSGAGHRRASGSHDRGTAGSSAHMFSGMDALLAAGSSAAAEDAEYRRAEGCSFNLRQGDTSPSAPARLTLQDVLRLSPHGQGSAAMSRAAADAAAHEPITVSWPHAMHEGQLSGDEVGAGFGAAHDADSSVSGDGSMEHEAAVVRTSTAGSHSLQGILEACRQEAAITAERTRLSRQLLAIGPLLMPDALRLRTAPGDAAMRAVLQRESPAAAGVTNLSKSPSPKSQPGGCQHLPMGGRGCARDIMQLPGSAAAAAASQLEAPAAHPGPSRGVSAHSDGGLGLQLRCVSANSAGLGPAPERAVLQALPEARGAVQSNKLLPLMLLLGGQLLERAR